MTHGSDFVVIGRVRRAHGTKGEVCVEPLTDFPERFNSLREILVEVPGSETRDVRIEAVRWKGKLALMKLGGVDDRTAADTYRGALLGLRREDVPPIGEDEYYFFDLVGCRVRDEKGGYLGVVEDVLRMPANDVLVVTAGGGGPGVREVLIPVVKNVLKKVDVESKEITIEMIPGLVDQ